MRRLDQHTISFINRNVNIVAVVKGHMIIYPVYFVVPPFSLTDLTFRLESYHGMALEVAIIDNPVVGERTNR